MKFEKIDTSFSGAQGQGQGPGDRDAPPGRKPYVSPRILSAEPLEVAAALCEGLGETGKGLECAGLTLGS